MPQTISRVNRKFGTKECGFIIDYIGIREEMKKAMKKYGGEVGPQEDLEVAHEVLQNELQLLQERLSGVAFDRFFGNNDLARLQFIHSFASVRSIHADTLLTASSAKHTPVSYTP